MKNHKLSNEEFLEELMSNCTAGLLTQVFVIEAIRYYAEKVSSTPEPENDSNAFISPKMWHKIATEISTKLKDNYDTPAAH